MRRGVDYIKASLELLPGPAAIYDLSDLSFADGNEAAMSFVQARLGDGVTREEAREAFGVVPLLREVEDKGVACRPVGEGFLWGSLLPANGQPRPDIVLVTIHHGVDAHLAEIEHKHMCMVVKVNETGQDAVQNLEAIIIQAKGSLRAQQKMLDDFNESAARFFRNHDGIGT